MIDYSINEIAAKSRLAVRGAGYSWGVAEDASRSVRWCVARSIPAPEALAELLLRRESVSSLSRCTPVLSLSDWRADDYLCPLLTGIALADHGHQFETVSSVTLHNVANPILLLAFVADIAVACDFHLLLSFDDLKFQFKHRQTQLNTQLNEIAFAKEVLCERFEPNGEYTGNVIEKNTDRVIVAEHAIGTLDRFAQRTYAPATQESRLLGAGAGLHDAD